MRVRRKSYEDAKTIQERLKSAGYNAKLFPAGEQFEVRISCVEVMRHPGLIVKICKVLREMYEETMSENNIKRMKRIVKAMAKLNCQNLAQGSQV